MEATCDYCGKTFERKKSQLDKCEHHFCSKKCHDKWKLGKMMGENNPKWNRIEVVCANCGNVLFPNTI